MLPATETFRHIYAPDRAHNPNEVLQNKYPTVKSLHGRFVAYSNEPYSKYTIWDSPAAFLAALEAMAPAERIYHEVIWSAPQKLKIDIDASADDLAALVVGYTDDPDIQASLNAVASPADKYSVVFDNIIQAVRDAFFTTYGMDLAPANEIICESVDVTAAKYSSHIILGGYYVTSHVQAQEFTRRVLSYLPTGYADFLDTSVNKRVQNFRVAQCRKRDGRVKRIISGHSIAESLITIVEGCTALPDIITHGDLTTSAIAIAKAREGGPPEVRSVHSGELSRILQLWSTSADAVNHTYRRTIDTMLIFDRVAPSHCDLCGRVHVQDNNLILTAWHTGKHIVVHRRCRKESKRAADEGRKARSVRLGEVTSDGTFLTGDGSTPRDDFEMHMERVIGAATGPSSAPYNPMVAGPDISLNEYDEPTLRPFEFVPTLVVRAAMKMGKTKALLDYMAAHFSIGAGESALRGPPIVRFVSFRRTFSGMLKERFPGFTLYSDVKPAAVPLSDPLLIVQVESLHRLVICDGMEPPDLLVLDECESILEQFDSGLMGGNFNACLAKFQWMVRYAAHVICMDANVGQRTYTMLRHMREVSVQRPIHVHWNTYKNATADRYWFTALKAKWLMMLHASLEADEPIVIPTTSLAEANTLRYSISQMYPKKTVLLYTGETCERLKAQHFANVDKYWSAADVLIYTPTVTAGVSFEAKHFTKVFGFFVDKSAAVETCQQMIGRIRDVADRQYYIYMTATGGHYPTEIADIAAALHTARENLGSEFDTTGLVCEYGPTGAIKYTSTYYHLWLENARMRNLSRNDFVRRFINMVASTGARCSMLSDEVFEAQTGIPVRDENGELSPELAEIQRAYTDAKKEARSERCEAIAAARDISEEEADTLSKIQAGTGEISYLDDDQRLALDKWRLRSYYHYGGEVTPEFVDTYDDAAVRRRYKNICRIHQATSIEDAWRRIQREESAMHRYLMDIGAEEQDLTRNYVFDQHRHALALLQLCGWHGIGDEQYIHAVTLTERLDVPLFWEHIAAAAATFHLKPVYPGSSLEQMIRLLNRILTTMYGVSISQRRGQPGLYYLRSLSMFTLDPNVSTSRRVPLIVGGAAVT